MYLATDYRNSVQSYGFFPEQPNIYGIFLRARHKNRHPIL